VASLKRLGFDDSKCNGCGECMTACSTTFFKVDDRTRSAIQVDRCEGGWHITVCDQHCRLCVDECAAKALSVSRQGVVTLDKKVCVGCLACVAVCPINAMRFVPGLLSPFKCNVCGACVKKCPTGAIGIVVEDK
jgi:anaerobic carbon-monoxide dehydrogenase iron sulfur subunit